jgi:syntaxin 5
MVAEQRETVQRIDADTTDIADNISGAQRELLKYYASISSNRWLMIKIFGAIIVVVSDHSLFTYLYLLLTSAAVPNFCPCKLIGQCLFLVLYSFRVFYGT